MPDYLEGVAFLGAQARGERDFVFAAADRHDEATDRIRAVRDRRYKYIRDYQPQTPYGQEVRFRNNLATMQEIFRLHDAGILQPPADWYYRQSKPIEELYDTREDPYELTDIAARPEMRDVLETMRAAHEDWVESTGDLGAVSEPELASRFWPGGVQPVTAAPSIDPAGGTFTVPVDVKIASPTTGASIAYTLEAGADPHWRLYTGPVRIDGDVVVRARAVRYGWAESAEAVAAFAVTP